jgi:oligopeptide/dipeptide ABC transporter ATP-binding protein
MSSNMSSGVSLLEVKDWHLAFEGETQQLKVLSGINLKVEAGQTVGLVGESGSGKSVMGLSIMGLLADNARHLQGEILFNGKRIFPSKDSSGLRGSEISMIFQDPVASLNPAFTVEYQIAETLKIHHQLQGRSVQDRCRELLQMVGIPDPTARLKAYPHELSGGMAQRVMIAIAIACRPKLLIADEPTTALDVTIQAQILNLLKQLQKETNLAVLLISHDMGVIAQNCERVNVMYCGEIIEEGSVQAVIHEPRHPYTQALLNCLPSKYVFAKSTEITRLPAIPGVVPALNERPTGCVFRDRCYKAQKVCEQKPPYMVFPEQKAACFFADQP